MLEPPRQLPAGAARELAALDQHTRRRFTRNLISMHGSTIFAVVALSILGVRDAVYLSLMLASGVAGIALAIVELRTGRDLLLAHNGLLVAVAALCARMFTPFLIAPGIIAINIIAFAFHPGGSKRWAFVVFAGACVLAIVGAYILEAVGVLTPT